MAAPTRRHLLRTGALLGVSWSAGCAAAPGSNGGDPRTTGSDRRTTGTTRRTTADDADTVSVPGDHESIQGAVDAASEGDLVLVEPGTYTEEVVVSTSGVTVRGRDRNRVVLDGEFDGTNGVEVSADGVALENLTARHYQSNGFYWSEVAGFRGSFLTAYNNGYYGVYAYGSRDGRFEHSYASGHPDAGFYLGRNRPYEAVVSDVVAEHNAIGYSGTSTGADLTIRDSVWRHNKVGIFPNTLDEADPPERASRIVGNEVYENNDEDAPALSNPYPLIGMGVLLWGGSDNVVEDNRIRDHDHFGVVAHPNVVEPSGNVVRDNRVGGSGQADLALGTPAGEGNRFRANEFETSIPAGIEEDAREGSEEVTAVFDALERRVDAEEFPAGDWRTQPEPGDQPSMPDPEAAPRPADKTTAWEAPQSQTDSVRDR